MRERERKRERKRKREREREGSVMAQTKKDFQISGRLFPAERDNLQTEAPKSSSVSWIRNK